MKLFYIYLSAALIFQFTLKAAPTVSVDNYPDNPPEPSSLIDLNGEKLSDVKDILTQMDESGEYESDVIVNIHYKNFVKENCCDSNGKSTGKVKFKVSSSDLEVEVKWELFLRLATWKFTDEYKKKCPDAIAEWERYIGAVHVHEIKHHNFSKTWASDKERIKRYFDNLASWESQCYEKEDAAAKAKDEIDNWAEQKAKEFANQISQDLVDGDPTDIKDPPGVGAYILDTSKDCK